MRYSMTRATLLALGALAATACTDLTEVPYSEVTQENFKPQARDLAALMAPAYVALRPMWMGWYGALDFQEETADVLITPPRPNGWYDGGTYIRLHEHEWTSSQGQPNSLWNNSYACINAANRVIYQIESGTVPVEEPTKTGTLAELRALRAYCYSMLLDNFGNVAIVTDFTDPDLPTQNTRQEVYDFVVSELLAAMPNLSTAVGRTTYGRMNQWAARGILARVYLNAAVYTGTGEWAKVIEQADAIIGSGLYLLESKYRAPFARNNDASKENVFAVPYDAVNANNSSFHMKTLKPDLRYVFNMQAGPWGGSASNPQFIDTYDPDDTRFKGLASEAGRGGTWLVGPQFDAQNRGYDFVQYMSPLVEQSEFNEGYPVFKYEIYSGETGASDVDYPILRYAEVLFMKAEALLRTGQADAAAALVSQVRTRAFSATVPAEATVTGAQLAQGSVYNYGWYDADGVVKTGPGGTPVTNGGADIQYGRFLDELGWEFAAEGHRRQDLIRFGVFTTKTWFNHTPNGDFRIIFAIPQNALNVNSNLVQNPGY